MKETPGAGPARRAPVHPVRRGPPAKTRITNNIPVNDEDVFHTAVQYFAKYYKVVQTRQRLTGHPLVDRLRVFKTHGALDVTNGIAACLK